MRCLLVLLLLASACTVTPRTQDGIQGGAIGGVAGAGAGALTGALIANGDIAMSAALGGAIGIPIGVMVALYMHDDKERQALIANNDIIRAKHERILNGRAKLDILRSQINDQTWELQQGATYGTRVFTQPTIGDYH